MDRRGEVGPGTWPWPGQGGGKGKMEVALCQTSRERTYPLAKSRYLVTIVL